MFRLFFEKYFWLWVCLFLGTASYQLAGIVGDLSKLWLPPLLSSLAGNEAHGKKNKKRDANSLMKSVNLFDPQGGIISPDAPQKKEDPTEEKDKEEKKELIEAQKGCPSIDPKAQYKETRLNVFLRGTVFVKPYSNDNMAAIDAMIDLNKGKKKRRKRKKARKTQERRVEMYGIGELVQKARICLIQRKEVLLLHQGKLEKLSLFTKKKRKPADVLYGVLGILGKGDQPVDNEVIKQAGQFDVSRATVQDWLNNPMAHAMSARIMPHYQNGKSAGFRMVWVRPKSLYSKLGIKSGDVIQQINGKTVDLNNAMSLYSELPYAKGIRINVVRGGQKQQLVYNIK